MCSKPPDTDGYLRHAGHGSDEEEEQQGASAALAPRSLMHAPSEQEKPLFAAPAQRTT